MILLYYIIHYFIKFLFYFYYFILFFSGNIFIMNGGEVALLDCGQVKARTVLLVLTRSKKIAFSLQYFWFYYNITNCQNISFINNITLFFFFLGINNYTILHTVFLNNIALYLLVLFNRIILRYIITLLYIEFNY